jgi:hypothetical protein
MRNANHEPVNGRPRRTNKPSGTHCDEGTVSDPSKAVFLSYASQDAEAAQNLCNALRAADIEVWFDQSELRGGDAWDASIRGDIPRALTWLETAERIGDTGLHYMRVDPFVDPLLAREDRSPKCRRDPTGLPESGHSRLAIIICSHFRSAGNPEVLPP